MHNFPDMSEPLQDCRLLPVTMGMVSLFIEAPIPLFVLCLFFVLLCSA